MLYVSVLLVVSILELGQISFVRRAARVTVRNIIRLSVACGSLRQWRLFPLSFLSFGPNVPCENFIAVFEISLNHPTLNYKIPYASASQCFSVPFQFANGLPSSRFFFAPLTSSNILKVEVISEWSIFSSPINDKEFASSNFHLCT